jgi:predicted RNA binding protein YcfA (HicA-like mRNA interferase family)
MPRRKRIAGKELIRALKKAGFEVVRVQGTGYRVAITAFATPTAV